MGAESNSNQNRKYAIDNIMRWLLFGIFLVVAPPLFNVWFKIIVGFDVNFIEYIPDMLLVMLSVCCNLINTCIDSDKKIAHCLRWILGVSLGIISMGCWGLFLAIRFSHTQEWYINNYYKDLASKLFYFSSGVILVCAAIGSLIEWYTVYKTKKLLELEVNNEK